MSERSLAAVVVLKMAINNDPIFFKQLDGNTTLRSRRGNGEACLHVLDDLEGGATNRNNFSSRFWRARCGLGLLCWRSGGGAAVAGWLFFLRDGFGFWPARIHHPTRAARAGAPVRRRF